MAFETTNAVSGTTNNPYDLSRTPGGSTGGAAAAIAAGFSALDIGSDGGGSIRLPAHSCGLAGLKPTTHRVSGAGHFPKHTGMAAKMAGYGPLARTVQDLVVAFKLLVGPDPRDPDALPADVDLDSDRPLDKLRVAFFTDNGIRTPTPETVSMVEQCAAELERAGAAVTQARLPNLAEACEIHLGLLVVDRSWSGNGRTGGDKHPASLGGSRDRVSRRACGRFRLQHGNAAALRLAGLSRRGLGLHGKLRRHPQPSRARHRHCRTGRYRRVRIWIGAAMRACTMSPAGLPRWSDAGRHPRDSHWASRLQAMHSATCWCSRSLSFWKPHAVASWHRRP